MNRRWIKGKSHNENCWFTVEDLRLPLRLYELRKAYAGDAEVQAQLDGVFEAILDGDVEGAHVILADVEDRND